jgi:hypothetical protein
MGCKRAVQWDPAVTEMCLVVNGWQPIFHLMSERDANPSRREPENSITIRICMRDRDDGNQPATRWSRRNKAKTASLSCRRPRWSRLASEEASSRAAPDEPSMRPLGGSRASNAEALGACGLAACPTPAARRDVTLFYSALKYLSFKYNAHLLCIIIHEMQGSTQKKKKIISTSCESSIVLFLRHLKQCIFLLDMNCALIAGYFFFKKEMH